MCGACEDEVFLTTPDPRSVLAGAADPAQVARTSTWPSSSRRQFEATEVHDAGKPLSLRAPPRRP
jgi:hypothetical protein